MEVVQLRGFIHDSLEKRDSHQDGDDGELPRREEDFLRLCDILAANMEELNESWRMDSTRPPQPTFEGPPNPGRHFTPSRELKSLYAQRNHLQRLVNYESKSGGSRTYLDYISEQLEEAERKVEPLEDEEWVLHERRVREYEEARGPYLERLRVWRDWEQERSRRREAETRRNELVRTARRRVERAFAAPPPSVSGTVTTLPWEFAPPGQRTDDHIVYGYYQEVLGRTGLKGFDQERLDKILALPRNGLLKGKAGFYGYIVLTFEHTDKVLMDCPVRDNAVYILDSGDERLLRMKKQDLMASDEARRIYHTDGWYERVRKELGLE